MIDRIAAALERARPRHLQELGRLVAIPTVSAQGRALSEGAAAVAELLEARGLEVAVHPTPGAPVVTAHGGEGQRSLLFYEHYDVQPAEPLEEWASDPFELTERDGRLYGRGVADTKGNLVCRLAAIDAVREALGGDPVRYVFVVEGEEEVGSPHLAAFLESHAGELRADGCVWESGGVDAAGRPSIYCGMKGVVTFELRCAGPRADLHSSYGAVVDNPLWRLAAALATLRDAAGRVTIDGFYDDVDPPSAADEAAVASQPDVDDEIRELAGVERLLGGARGVELRRRLQLEPCLNVNGIHGGYGGPGSKTVLPKEGVAKLDVRLVPSQRPERVAELLRAHLERRGFGDVEVVMGAGEPAARTPTDDPFVQLVVRTAELAYGRPAVLKPMLQASGPVHAFREHLGVPFASAGCGYPGSQVHAPNEHLRLEDFSRGALHSALIVAAMAGAL